MSNPANSKIVYMLEELIELFKSILKTLHSMWRAVRYTAGISAMHNNVLR